MSLSNEETDFDTAIDRMLVNEIDVDNVLHHLGQASENGNLHSRRTESGRLGELRTPRPSPRTPSTPLSSSSSGEGKQKDQASYDRLYDIDVQLNKGYWKFPVFDTANPEEWLNEARNMLTMSGCTRFIHKKYITRTLAQAIKDDAAHGNGDDDGFSSESDDDESPEGQRFLVFYRILKEGTQRRETASAARARHTVFKHMVKSLKNAKHLYDNVQLGDISGLWQNVRSYTLPNEQKLLELHSTKLFAAKKTPQVSYPEWLNEFQGAVRKLKELKAQPPTKLIQAAVYAQLRHDNRYERTVESCQEKCVTLSELYAQLSLKAQRLGDNTAKGTGRSADPKRDDNRDRGRRRDKAQADKPRAGASAGTSVAPSGTSVAPSKARKEIKKIDKPCMNWEATGKCDYGDRCKFKHVIKAKANVAFTNDMSQAFLTGTSAADDSQLPPPVEHAPDEAPINYSLSHYGGEEELEEAHSVMQLDADTSKSARQAMAFIADTQPMLMSKRAFGAPDAPVNRPALGDVVCIVNHPKSELNGLKAQICAVHKRVGKSKQRKYEVQLLERTELNTSVGRLLERHLN
jgi:hypothetical protein